MIKKCDNCQTDFDCSPMINGKKRNFQRRRFCLICSPFKSHNTKKIIKSSENKKCCKCNETMHISQFYKNNGNTCKKCNTQNTIERQRKFKELCVEYKGGKCEKCGYNKCYGSLDFHHLDPSIKIDRISKWKLTSIELNFENVKLELDKCILVCKNCHGELHWGFDRHLEKS